ncbi:MAG: flagellar hook-associated protein FlgK [Spirochaetaceae bacterium]|nr:MAG: flagellar hook-associated protein FlgK [Spirochaetaceae bacterium]
MQSTFSGIEIGKRSLLSHSIGLSTVGHNLANASVEGYSRQRVEMSATDAIYRPQLNRAERPGQIGQGVDVARIERIRDGLLEQRLVAQANGEGYWGTRDSYVSMLEQIYNEPSDLSVRHLMDQFWDGWQELSIFPEQMAPRHVLLQRGESLIEGINSRYESLHMIRTMLDDDVRASVGQINDLTAEIAKINEEIIKVKAVGDNPNDLLDRRDLLVEKLSGFIQITTDSRDPDEFHVHTGGFHLVQGRIARPFDTRPEPLDNGFSRVVWAHSDEDVRIRGGRLGALVELRDGDVRTEIQKLDTMTINFVDLVNEIHRDAYGLNGRTDTDFFSEYPFVENILGNYDRSGDGAFDSTYLYRMTGAHRLTANEQIGLSGTMTFSAAAGTLDVQYNPTDTVRDIVARINTSGAEVVARIDRNGSLELRATAAADRENPDFVIRNVEDSGQFLVGYAGILPATGPDGAYAWDQPDAALALRDDSRFSVSPLMNPSGWIAVNPEIAGDPATIGAGFGSAGRAAESGDGAAALAVAALRNSPVMVGQTATFDDYFADAVAEIGLKGEQAALAIATQNQIMKDLRDFRQAISGVNIDEELAMMIKFQHGYNAAARFITTVDRMLDTIINRLGV